MIELPSSIVRLGLSIVLVMLPFLGVASGRDQTADSILALSLAASGGDAWNKIRSLHISGHGEQKEPAQTKEEWDDVVTGRYVVRETSGNVPSAGGFDGQSSWIQPQGAYSYVFGDQDARLIAINNSFQCARAFWFPTRRASSMRFEGTKQEDGRSYEVISITPEGGRPFSIWIDSETHLIERYVEQEAERVSAVHFSDYRTVEGVKLPFTIRSGREGADDWSIEAVDSVIVNSPLSDGRFALPPVPTPDFHSSNGKTSVTLPFRLENNVLLVQVKLNGQGPFEAMFDSGGDLLLQPNVVNKLKLDALGSKKAYGGGEGSSNSGLVTIDSIDLGDFHISTQRASVLPIFDDAPERILFGSEILLRFAVRLDFDRNFMTLTPLEKFSYRGSGTVIPFHFQDNQPEVYGTVDGISGVFAIDTGDNGSLLLIAPFARKYNFFDRYHATIPEDGQAVGGQTYGLLARAHAVTLAGFDGRPALEVLDPITRLSQQKGGFDANRYVSGNIGLGILKQFNVTFDYRHQQIIFEKNHLYGQFEVYSRTGLSLTTLEDRWRVDRVIPASPAALVGIQAGTEILSINGKSPKELKIAELKALFREPVGTVLKLEVESAGVRRHTDLVLKDIL